MRLIRFAQYYLFLIQLLGSNFGCEILCNQPLQSDPRGYKENVFVVKYVTKLIKNVKKGGVYCVVYWLA